MSSKPIDCDLDVFISYSRLDRQVAEKLHSLLSKDLSVFLDTKSLQIGEDWARELARAQQTAKVVVILVSRTTDQAYYVREEVAAAIAQTRLEPNRQLVVPIYLDVRPETPSDVPYGLRQLAGIYISAKSTIEDAAKEIRYLARSRERQNETGSGPSIWNVPTRRVLNFLGRDEALSELGRWNAGGLFSSRYQVIVGLGGVGKTQLAVEYAYKNRHRFSIVWWVRAANRGLLTRDLAALAPSLGVTLDRSIEDTAVAVKARLTEASEPWLLVFDDAPSPDAIDQWVPKSTHGQVIVTSRAAGWEFADQVRVDTLDMNAATSLLLEHTQTGNEGAARRLALRLGGHPLSLELAAATMRSSGESFEDYERHLDELVIGDYGRVTEVARSMQAILDDSLSNAEKSDPRSMSFLQRLSLLAPVSIPLWIFEGDRDPHLRSSLIARAVQSLSELGLLRLIDDSSISVHGLVQQSVRSRMSPPIQRRCIDDTLTLLMAAFPNDPRDPAAWPLCVDLLPHVLAAVSFADDRDTASVLALLDRVGTNAMSRGDVPQAEVVLRGSVERAQRIFGDEHPTTLACVSRLAGALRALGNLAEAHVLQMGVLDRQRRLHGEDDPVTLASMSNLAETLRLMGDLSTARLHQNEVLQRQRRTLGDENPATLASMANLAGTLRDMGNLAGARELQHEVLERRRRVLGEEDPATLASMSNLAGTMRAMGELPDARLLQEMVLARQRRVLGHEHPETLASMNNLAATLYALGDVSEARSLYEKALAAGWSQQGPEHPDTLATMSNLGFVRAAIGDLPGARHLQEEALSLYRRLYGSEHPATLTSMNNFAELLRTMKDFEGARHMHETTLATLRSVLGEEHPSTVTSMNNLASTLYEMGELNGARELYEQVVIARKRVLGENHPDTRAAATNLAETISALKTDGP